MPPPRPRRRWDLLVVGAGTGGLIGAQTAASLGARVLADPQWNAAIGDARGRLARAVAAGCSWLAGRSSRRAADRRAADTPGGP